MKVYISGKITGLPNYRDIFAQAERDLLAAGLQPINPAELELQEGATWADYMRADIKVLCDCDAIYMLDNWRRSRGARAEHNLAKALGMQIIHEGALPLCLD